MAQNVASSNGNSSWRGSASTALRRRHARGRLGRTRSPLATSCFVGHPLTLGAKQSEVCALDIVNTELDAVRVAEIELGKVALQVGRRNMLIHAVNPALQDREISSTVLVEISPRT
jgi:hypothetical protein